MMDPLYNKVPSTRRFADEKPPTFFDDDDYKRDRRPQTTQNLDEQTPTSSGHKRMALFVLGVAERVDFDMTPRIVLGRFEGAGKKSHHLDLTDYGAVNRGVSRVHCQLEFENGSIIVTDLGSTNGTFVGGIRLEPNEPHVLQRGQELVIGRLPIQIVSGR